MSENKSYQLLTGGLFLALALGLPLAFHLVGLGSSFLPMFYPILLAGFLLDFQVAVLVGLLSPLLSAALTGMPPFYPPIAFIMMAEAIVMTGLPFLLYRRLRMNIYLTLFVTIVAERAILLVATWVVADWLKLPGMVLSSLTLLKGLPGLVIIFLVIPPLVRKIEKKISQSPFFPGEVTTNSKMR